MIDVVVFVSAVTSSVRILRHKLTALARCRVCLSIRPEKWRCSFQTATDWYWFMIVCSALIVLYPFFHANLIYEPPPDVTIDP